jgi:hypothetical protein
LRKSYGRDRWRIQGWPRQAAVAQPVQEGSIRQPARPAPEGEKSARAARRRAERAGGRHGQRRAGEITKREAVIAQLVDKSTGADLRATKMLIDMLTDIERRAGMTAPPEPPLFTAADEEVVENLIARLRRAELAKIHRTDMENRQKS